MDVAGDNHVVFAGPSILHLPLSPPANVASACLAGLIEKLEPGGSPSAYANSWTPGGLNGQLAERTRRTFSQRQSDSVGATPGEPRWPWARRSAFKRLAVPSYGEGHSWCCCDLYAELAAIDPVAQRIVGERTELVRSVEVRFRADIDTLGAEREQTGSRPCTTASETRADTAVVSSGRNGSERVRTAYMTFASGRGFGNPHGGIRGRRPAVRRSATQLAGDTDRCHGEGRRHCPQSRLDRTPAGRCLWSGTFA